MTTILQSYINSEEAEERAKNNKRADLKYIGSLPHLKGKRGTGYFIVEEERWYFRPCNPHRGVCSKDTGCNLNDEYRVNTENLDFER